MSDMKKPIEIKEETVEAEFVDEFDGIDVEMILPSMNVSQEMIPPKEECIIKDDELTGLYDEILDNCRKDRAHADDILNNFFDMVINDGDASSASKEAIVNILNIKSGISDKMSKIADLKTRIKLKDKDTFPRYLAAQQNNKVVIESSKMDLLKSVGKMVKDKNNKLSEGGSK